MIQNKNENIPVAIWKTPFKKKEIIAIFFIFHEIVEHIVLDIQKTEKIFGPNLRPFTSAMITFQATMLKPATSAVLVIVQTSTVTERTLHCSRI